MKYMYFFTPFLALLFFGCGSKTELFSGFKKPNDNKAMLYVYRPDTLSFFGWSGGYTTSVEIGDYNATLKGTNKGVIYPKAFASKEVPANSDITVWAVMQRHLDARADSLNIRTKPNETYCVKITPQLTTNSLSLEDMETCKKEISAMHTFITQ